MAKFKGVERPCVVCGKVFRSPKCQAHVQSCSNECGNTLRGRRKEWVELKCACCGKVFHERQCHADRRTYCSKECLHSDAALRDQRSKRFSGDRNPQWRGGITVKSISSTGKVYPRSSPAKENARANRKRTQMLRAIPPWADMSKVLVFYEECQRVTAETGVPHHVDHIVPIQSKYVCGLHCEMNLQILTGTENIRKGNKHWPGKA